MNWLKSEFGARFLCFSFLNDFIFGFWVAAASFSHLHRFCVASDWQIRFEHISNKHDTLCSSYRPHTNRKYSHKASLSLNPKTFLKQLFGLTFFARPFAMCPDCLDLPQWKWVYSLKLWPWREPAAGERKSEGKVIMNWL